MYCVWLTFNSANLSEIILKLARKYNGPVFQPHCTLLGCTNISLSKIKSALINIDINCDLSEIHPEKISFENKLYRALYIELIEKQILTMRHKDICDLISTKYDENYLPHISLMYNTISFREKKNLSDKIKLKSVYIPYSIQIIDCGDNINEWKSVFELKI